MLDFRVDAIKCTACDICVVDCPSGIIYRNTNIPEVVLPESGRCLECQHCLAVCPTGAVSVFGLKPQKSIQFYDGVFPSYDQMKALARGRRSVRKFQKDEVSPAVINELLTDIAHAPTGCNDRDLVFTVIEHRKDMEILLEKLVKTIETMQASGEPVHEFIAAAASAYRKFGKDNLFRGAPHLLIVSPGEKAHTGQEDAIIALSYFELLAQSAGLGTTWCGMIKIIADLVPGTRDLLGLTPNVYFYAMMFGKPAVKFERTVQRDADAKIRRLKFT